MKSHPFQSVLRREHVSNAVDRMETLELRRHLTSASFDPQDGKLGNGHGVGCGCSGCCGPGLVEAMARNGADHDASWYTPVASASLSGGPEASPPPTFPTNAAGLPLLTSRADGQGLKIFLDFDGNGSNLPFGLDANDATFNAAEQTAIYETWREIVSYYSPFNVNVTTIQPPTGPSDPLFAWQLTSKSISGLFAAANSLTRTEPTAFNEASNAVSRRSGIAHEVGHILGLLHQSEFDRLGGTTFAYTDGFGPRDASIMGVDFATNVRNFFFGRSSEGVATLQDDIFDIAATVASVTGDDGFRPDDFGDSPFSAFVVTPDVQQIPGIIERHNDVDLFQVSIADAGTWHFDATPTFESSVSPKLELFDSLGRLIASRDDADQRNERNNDVEFTREMQPGTYFVRVTSSGDYSELGEYLLTVSPLPTGFISADVSTTIDRPGTSSFDPATGVLTLLGAGTGITSTADQFRFTHDTFTGDGSITARVLSLDNFNAAGKAGLMFRASAGSNSAFVMVNVTPSGGVEFIRRTSTGGATSTLATAAPGSLARWLRLSRAGDTFTAQHSPDGVTWTTLGSPTTVTLPASSLAGFATSSHNSRAAGFAEFDNIAFTGTLGEAPPTFNALASPESLVANAATGASTAVVLNWDDVAGESGYGIERSVDGVNFTRISSSVAPDTTTFTDNLTFGSMRWWYRVVALSGSTASAPGAPASVVNKPSAPTIPNASYAPPAISAASGTAIYLNWSDVQGDQGYLVERSTDGVTFEQIGTTEANRNAFNDTTVSPATAYRYRITPITFFADGVVPSLTMSGASRWTNSDLRIASRSASSMTLAWSDLPAESGYRIERSTSGLTNWTTVANLPANRTSWVDTAVTSASTSASEYHYRISAVLPLAEVSLSAVAFAGSLPTASNPLPAGWTGREVGNTGGLGSVAGVGTTTFKVIGGGTSIGNGPADSFYFVYRRLVGDGSITVQLNGQKINGSDNDAEAGVMIRDSLAVDSAYAFVNAEPRNARRVDFETRKSAGFSVSEVIGPTSDFFVWMRLSRTGINVVGEASRDGINWTVIASRVLNASTTTPIYIGMAVSAIEANVLSNAVFSNVVVSGNTSVNETPTISSPAFAPAPVTGTTANLNVLAADDAGEAALTYTWSTIASPSGAPAPAFAASNGTNAAKNIAATFGAAGSYAFRVTATDAGGLTTTSDVSVSVVSTFTSLNVTPTITNIAPGATQLFAATALDQFGGSLALPSIDWLASSGTIAAGSFTAPTTAGPVTITASSGAITASTTVRVDLVAEAPTFNFELSPHTLSVNFNGNVSSSLSASDFVITNTTTAQVIPSTDVSVVYDTITNRATLSYVPGALPDGNYSLSVAPADVLLDDGQLLSAPVSFNFRFLRGDATNDGVVNFADLLIIARNYGQSGRTFSQGDFNYDNQVDFNDLLILARLYGNVFSSSGLTVAAKQKNSRAGQGIIT